MQNGVIWCILVSKSWHMYQITVYWIRDERDKFPKISRILSWALTAPKCMFQGHFWQCYWMALTLLWVLSLDFALKTAILAIPLQQICWDLQPYCLSLKGELTTGTWEEKTEVLQFADFKFNISRYWVQQQRSPSPRTEVSNAEEQEGKATMPGLHPHDPAVAHFVIFISTM